MNSQKKNKSKFKIILTIFALLLLADGLIWGISVYSNRQMLKKDLIAIVQPLGDVPQIKTDCRVNVTKGIRTTSCSVTAIKVIEPEESMESTLNRIYGIIEENGWRASIEGRKQDLITTHRGVLSVEFKPDKVSKYIDYDRIRVVKVSNGSTLSDAKITSDKFGANDTDLIAIKFYRDQMSSVTHFIIGQLVSF